MIKFFRHIRKSLIQENKMGKYFKYAIGEIILVMIGILLALQVNNWNENRKGAIAEQKIIKTLHEEFKQNKVTLDSLLQVFHNTENALSFILKRISPSPTRDISAETLDSTLYHTLGNPYWEKSEYTLKNLENSGELSHLSNEELKQALYKWSLVSKDIEDKDADTNISFNYYLNFFKQNGSLRNLDWHGNDISQPSKLSYDHFSFLSNIAFENALDDYLVFVRQRISRYKKARKLMERIINLSDTVND